MSGVVSSLGERMAVITCVEDLRQLHAKRVPKMFYDYAESGSWSEATFRQNEQRFQDLKLRQRVAVDISQRSLSCTMLGEKWRMPVGIAPTGLSGMQHANGEILAAQAAEEFGIPYCLSTMSICSIEDVAAHTKKPFWFQLYVMRDRDFVADLIARAKAAGCSALVLTLDLQILGQRHRDLKNSMSAPPKLTLKNLVNMATKPRWCAQMLGTRRRSFGNIVGHAKNVGDLSSLSVWSAEQLDPTMSWEDVEWVKSLWDGPLILKGVMDATDAIRAASLGADGLIVSNHGGRQRDGAPASIEVLPEIVDAVGNQIDVYMDGGIRSGQDVYKAIASGAKGTFIGKAFLNGLGAQGKQGVTTCLDIIEKELDLTMAFCGYTDISAVDRSTFWSTQV